MKIEFNHLDVGVNKYSFNGLVEAIKESPIGDIVPRVGLVEFGGNVRVNIEGEDRVLEVKRLGKGVVVGDKVFTHWLGTETVKNVTKKAAKS